ncbi:hypothetical protein M427DRAFT_156090 [Gonapodya prolifera JEL478]|uniref:Uncharacterized protein n=1 Tax=Gonapodya prolifera (strain JEL478) TaxID=1344416 RepID=A0A139AC00_GONPJ|nr:hypothetical protein M427DRAFT_156090 [Gonapodya prolifera JEL478]|eukprot:KXS14331.1 hypothetical protein M427DRAFT_156090 [Gonapodya prolifera JEL478]
MVITADALERAQTLYLVKRFDEALKICEEAFLDPELRSQEGFLRFYLELCYRAGKGQALERITTTFPNPAQLPGDVVVFLLQLKIKNKEYAQAKGFAENWLGSCTDDYVRAVMASREPQTTVYEQVTELYVLHILPRLSDFELASEFLHYNDILQPARKAIYDRSLNLVQTQYEALAKVEAAAAAAREGERVRREASRRLEEGAKEGRLSKRTSTAPASAASQSPAEKPQADPSKSEPRDAGKSSPASGLSVRTEGEFVIMGFGGTSLRFHKHFLMSIPAILFAVWGLLTAVRRYRARIVEFTNRVTGSMARMASVAMSPQSF